MEEEEEEEEAEDEEEEDNLEKLHARLNDDRLDRNNGGRQNYLERQDDFGGH